MNKSYRQSYDKTSLSDKNQVQPLWIWTISLWTAMEINLAMCGSRKYPYHPHGRDWIFQGGGGSICLIFQWGGGVLHREIFPDGSRDAY